jgi:hypothetical protein
MKVQNIGGDLGRADSAMHVWKRLTKDKTICIINNKKNLS